MAHRGPMREVFGILCMAVLIKKSEKKASPPASTVYIETVAAVDDYFNVQNITVIHPTSPPPTGYLPSILSFLLLALSVVGNQLLDSLFHLALHNILLPLLRIARRWSVAIITSSWQRVHGWRSRGRVTEGVATSNTSPPTDNKINESSRSDLSQVATAAPDDVDNNKKINELSRSAPSQLATPVPTDTTVSATSDGPANGHEVDNAPQSTVQQTITALSDEDDVWINDEDSDPSSARIFDSAPISSTSNQVFAAFRAQLGRRDKRVANLSKPANFLTKKTANPKGRKTRLIERLRKTLDPKSLYSPNSNVLVIARDMNRNFKRVNNKVMRQKRALAASRAHQENMQLRQKAIANTKLSTANRRLEHQILRLEMGQQSSVQEARNIERQAAWQREKRLVEQRNAANDRLSDSISQASYDSLKNSFNTLRDHFKEAQEGRKAAVDELQAERAKTETLAQQGSESTAIGTTVPSEDRITSLEQEALARDEAVQDAEVRAQEARTRAQEAEAKAQEAEAKAQELEAKAQETELKTQDTETRLQEAEAKTKEAETRVQSAINRAQDAELKVQTAEGRIITLQQELGDSKQQLEQNLQRAEEAQEEASNEAEGPSNQELYDQGYQAAVRDCEAEAQVVLTQKVNAAVASRDAEVLAQFNTEVENAVALGKAPLLAELNAANERATTAESRAANNANTALTQALRRATTAKARADTADAALKEAQSSHDTIRQKASKEWQRVEDMREIATNEYNRAEAAEEEVQKFKKGKESQDARIRGYLDDISRLKRLIPANAALMAEELDSITRDRLRAQALAEEFTVRSYDWDTKQVLKKLLDANEKIIELECMLKDPKTQPSQIEFLKVLVNAGVDPNHYMNLNLPMRQVIVKQCRAVNVRLNDLKTIINKSERPKKEELLFEIYKVRGDEEAYYDEDDPEPEPSSDEDEDEIVTDYGAQHSAPRRLNLPTSRRAKPATVPQVVETPLPVDARVQNDLKRKGFPNDEPDTSQIETGLMVGPPSHQFPQQASLSPKAAEDSMQRSGEASSAQKQSIDPTNLDPQLTAIGSTPVQHYPSANPFASTATPSHLEQAPQPKPARTPGPRQKPQLTASERQQRLRYIQYPESEASSAQEAAAPTSTPGPTNFSFSMPKNIASGIQPHVRKYTRLSGMTNFGVAAVNPPPATPNRDPIFKGLSLLGPAMADKKWMTDKKAALPGLPPPEDDDVLEFESAAVTEDPAPGHEVEDRHQTHTASDDEEDGKTSDTFLPNESTLTGVLRRYSLGEDALLIRRR